jgi:hypothetical protein
MTEDDTLRTALAAAAKLAESADLIKGALSDQLGRVPGEVVEASLPVLQRLAGEAEQLLSEIEAPCARESRNFFPPARHKAARQAAEAAAPPAANKLDQPDPERAH